MKRRLFRAVILGFAVGLIGLLLNHFQFALNLEENTCLGLLFRLRGVAPPSDEVVVVSTEKASSDHLGLPNKPDKWLRSLHARLVDNLVRGGTATITFDLHFIEFLNPAVDRRFAPAIKKARNVVFSEPLIAK